MVYLEDESRKHNTSIVDCFFEGFPPTHYHHHHHIINNKKKNNMAQEHFRRCYSVDQRRDKQQQCLLRLM